MPGFFLRWDTQAQFPHGVKKDEDSTTVWKFCPAFFSVEKEPQYKKEMICHICFPICRRESNIALLGCQYVDHYIEILSHDRDYSNFGFHETALLRFSRLWTKA